MVKRVVVIVLAAILLLGGVGLAVAGGALVAVFGTDNTLHSDQEPLSTRTSALVASIDDIEGTKGFASVVGQPSFRLTVTSSSTNVFVGVGPAAAVDSYLADSAIDKVTDFDLDPFRLDTSLRDGTATPAPPGAQDFWIARADGQSATVNWKIKDGSYRVVVMNADGSAGVQTTGSVRLVVPHLFAIGVGVLIAGVVLTLIGVVLLIVGIRMGRPRRTVTQPVQSPYDPAGRPF